MMHECNHLPNGLNVVRKGLNMAAMSFSLNNIKFGPNVVRKCIMAYA